MNLTFSDYINDFVTIYLDNILVYSETYYNTWIILEKSLSISGSLNYIANSKNANLESVRLSI